MLSNLNGVFRHFHPGTANQSFTPTIIRQVFQRDISPILSRISALFEGLAASWHHSSVCLLIMAFLRYIYSWPFSIFTSLILSILGGTIWLVIDNDFIQLFRIPAGAALVSLGMFFATASFFGKVLSE